MRILLALAALTAIVSFGATSATATDPEAWAGQVTERDTYVEANPVSLVRDSCTSTAAVGLLTHIEGQWSFYTENDCGGYDVRFTEEQCDTDESGVLACYYADVNGTEHWLTFEPDGDFRTEYLSNAAFKGDNYVIEGNLTPL